MGGPKILGGGGKHGGGGAGRQAGGRTDWQMGSAPDQAISNRVRFGMMTEKKTPKAAQQHRIFDFVIVVIVIGDLKGTLTDVLLC